MSNKKQYKIGDVIIITNSREPERYENGEIFTIVDTKTWLDSFEHPHFECYDCENASGNRLLIDISEFKLYQEENNL